MLFAALNLKSKVVAQFGLEGVVQVKKGRGIGDNYAFDTLDEDCKQTKILKRANIFVVTKPDRFKETLEKMAKTSDVSLVSSSQHIIREAGLAGARRVSVISKVEELAQKQKDKLNEVEVS